MTGRLALLLGLFAVPAFLLWAGHHWRHRSARVRGAFWGGLIAHSLAALIATGAGLYRPAEWEASDHSRGFFGLWSMLVFFLVGAAIGAVVNTRRNTRGRTAGVIIALLIGPADGAAAQARVRARDLGIAPGVFQPGSFNAITDVAGVRVGHATIVDGDSVRTGITAILPHSGNLYRERVPAALHVGNGFGKLLGATQLEELGEIETPILLTCTLCVWKAADAMIEWMLGLPQMENVRSINPVVGETNDGALNAIRSRPIAPSHVIHALTTAAGGRVAEGSVGAGTGTSAFGWKGGIGTSSRKLPASLGDWTVGVLVQSNYGGVLQMMGAPVGRELGRYSFRTDTTRDQGDGSIIMVVATDAPLSDRNLGRLAARAMMGLARTGSSASNGSGDYAIAFSTALGVRRPLDARRLATSELANEEMSGLFQATVEATEEAIYNSLTMATAVTSRGRTVEALPLDRLQEILRKYGVAVPKR